jgi:nitrogen PTS system EIIA component
MVWTLSPATLNIFARYLSAQDVWLGLHVADRRDLFQAIGRSMQRAHAIACETVVTSLLRREHAGSTALGQGVAIPHARLAALKHIVAGYAQLARGILFDAPDAKPVLHVLVLLVPAPAADEHLEILAAAARLFSDSAFRDRLQSTADPLEVVRLFSTWPTAG